MVAFCDIIRERAEKAAAQYGAEGAKVYEDYHDLLADRRSTWCTCSPPTWPTAPSPWPPLRRGST